MLQLLQYGFNPYEDNSALEGSIFADEKSKTTNIPTSLQKDQQLPTINQQVVENQKVSVSSEIAEPSTIIKEAILLTLELKVDMMNKNSFVQYKSRIGLFEKWLKEKEYYKESIIFITKKIVIDYLNEVLIKTSARNRNNSRTDIASMFQLLEDNEIILDNFVKKISVLKSVPKRNKTYSQKLEKEIYKHLEKVDSHLFLFIKFISYSILRPIEICRLKIEDVELQDKKLYIKAKNKPVQIKIIPEILLNDLPDLSKKDPKAFLFGRYEIGEEWDAE
ncbi:MAG: site-specific integrase [Polaribacter sp.]|uniref:site-specific integrase n=1 Tax=Polaribacter sp. TaxID=1920175 RepID=UPI002F357BC6